MNIQCTCCEGDIDINNAVECYRCDEIVCFNCGVWKKNKFLCDTCLSKDLRKKGLIP